MTPPDFEQIARDFIQPDVLSPDPEQVEALRHDMAINLRQVWNARGAADVQAVVDRLRQDGGAICEFDCAHVADAAIKEQDR